MLHKKIRKTTKKDVKKNTLPGAYTMTNLVSTKIISYKNSYGRYWSYLYTPKKSKNPLPTIIFAPGSMCWAGWYTWIGELLAKSGYAVIAFTVPELLSNDLNQWVGGFHSAIEYILENKKKFDSDRIGLMGHSLGANTLMLSIVEDDLVRDYADACICLAPGYPKLDGSAHDPVSIKLRDASLSIFIPIQIQCGTCDGFSGYDASVSHYNQLPNGKELITIDGGNHAGFLDIEYGLPYQIANVIDDKATISHTEQIRQSGQSFLNWFNRYLK